MIPHPTEPAKRYIGIDAHPDVLTIAIMEGDSPKELKLIKLKHRLALEDLIDWSKKYATPQDIFLMEASGNSFGIAEKLSNNGYQALVLESRSVSLTSDPANDDDKKAAQRIVQSWLSGHVPTVWRPDEKTRSLRLLLEAYLDSVTEDTRATNRLKGILNTYTIRLGKKDPRHATTQQEILANPKWSFHERLVIQDAIDKVNYASQRRETLLKTIQSEVRNNKKMLACLRIEGIGVINAFAILAIIGDIKRFATARKLASYIGINPRSKTSGNSINIKYGIAKHGRRDLKTLLIQAAQTILRSRRNTKLQKWGLQ
ncbi:MAG: IS110 family transposase, partial [Akkermansia sp.]